MNDNIDEQWLQLERNKTCKNPFIAVSNTGKYRRADGTVGILKLRQKFQYCGKLEYAYRVIAEHFLITVRRPDQKQIDHISHHPTEYNINDVRNLRWCTEAENHRFEEARENLSKSKNGKYCGEKNPSWKGDEVSNFCKYRRAKKLYKAGLLSESEFQPYRDARQEERKGRSNK